MIIDLLKSAICGVAIGYLIYHVAQIALAALDIAAPTLLAAAR